MSFDAELLRAEAIREIRAHGCDTPGVAEIIVRHHGPHHVLGNLHRIEQLLEEIFIQDLILAEELREILDFQERHTAKSLRVKINGGSMNTVLTVGQTGQATAHEFSGLNGTGSELPLAGKISWASSDSSVATVDPVSGVITAVAESKKDANGAPIPVDITGTDAANGLFNPPGDATVTDQPLKAASLTVSVAVNPSTAAK